jgi:hypothetical protein
MLDPTDQAEVLEKILAVAKRMNLLVAPVGSVYFLYHGQPRLRTTDVDTVVLTDDGEPVSLEVLESFGRELGHIDSRSDGASVIVRPPETETSAYEIDLLRGKEKTKRGFFPRALLREAAKRGRIEGNLIWFPIEYVIVLKADAAVDRKQRAANADEYSRDNAERAKVFEQDVFAQVQQALGRGMLKAQYIVDASRHLKESRRRRVLELIEAAAFGQLRLT